MPMNPRLLRPLASRFFLDQHSGARLAFSLRRLSSRYAGPVVRVRRSNDNAEADFWAADVAGGALAAWVGTGNNGFVRTWYDQSGNGSHAQQATSAAQPKIVNNGLLCIDTRGFPTILCDGAAIYGMTVTATGVFANDLFFATVLQPNNVSGGSRVFAPVTGQPHSDFRLDHANQRWLYYSGASFVNTGTLLPQGQNPIGLFGVRAINGSPGSAWIRKDGSIIATNTNMSNHTSGNTGTAFSLFSFGPAAALGYVGTVTEFVAWSDSRPNTFQQIDDQLIRHYTRLPTPLYADADVNAYISAVELADGNQMLETGVRDAYNDFITGCKADGIWDAIKASCILAGARTLAGALVPLKPLGPELWSPSTPSIVDFGGSTGSWNADTLTMTNTGTGANASYPRFTFSLPLFVGNAYAVSGRLTGDVAAVTLIRLAASGVASNVSYNSATGVFSGDIVTASVAAIEFHLNATLGNASVSIAELSIRETSAPTNNNFVSGDYNRETGLVGNASTKRLNSNRANNADPQDSKHIAFFASDLGPTAAAIMGTGGGNTGATNFYRLTQNEIRLHSSTSNVWGLATAGFNGANRAAASGLTGRSNGTNTAITKASQTPSSGSIEIFAQSGQQPSDARLAFYSIGESLDLALLDNRVSTLITAIGAAI